MDNWNRWGAADERGAASASAWPGLHLDCAELLAEADITVLGADNVGVEVFPSQVPDCQVPLHVALVRGRGVFFSELLAVGSPVAPVAVV